LVFFRIALRNVARNWNRTGMIIIGMMVASALITITMAVAPGYTDLANLSYRQMTGADILIYPNRFVFEGPGEGTATWELRALSPDLPTDAFFFHPGLPGGYLSPADAPPPAFDLSDLPEMPAAIDGVLKVTPLRLLPAYAVIEADPGGRTVVIEVAIRGRDVSTDVEHFNLPQRVTSGDYLDEGDEGEWVALINAYPTAGLTSLSTGDRLVVRVPQVSGYARDGAPAFDYSRTVPFELRVKGEYVLSLGAEPMEGLTDPMMRARPPMVEVGLDEPEIWVTAETFDRIYEAVAGGPQRYTGQLGVIVRTMYEAKIIAARLSEALPYCSVLTVPQEVDLSGMNYEVKSVDGTPMRFVVTREYRSRAVVSDDIKSELSVLAFIVAGLLVVANMYILVTQRRREIGILKAVGASGGDIFTLILTEALGYSLAGSVIGWGSMRLLTLILLLTSKVSFVEGALMTLESAGVAVGLTTVTALIFGFLPALEAARTPSASLLDG